ncbi:Uncharacterised protein [Halioglobus japonicus]|nr:Uncharacterised protein [Halioglobus japonicus]
MQLTILVVAMMLGLFVLFRLRMVRSAQPNNRKSDRRRGFAATHPFRAVSIEMTPGSCNAARSIASQRFLREGAPPLPLAKCNAAQCRCRYTYHADRRSGDQDRRLGPVEESDESEFWSMRNRRSFLGRRIAERSSL